MELTTKAVLFLLLPVMSVSTQFHSLDELDPPILDHGTLNSEHSTINLEQLKSQLYLIDQQIRALLSQKEHLKEQFILGLPTAQIDTSNTLNDSSVPDFKYKEAGVQTEPKIEVEKRTVSFAEADEVLHFSKDDTCNSIKHSKKNKLDAIVTLLRKSTIKHAFRELSSFDDVKSSMFHTEPSKPQEIPTQTETVQLSSQSASTCSNISYSDILESLSAPLSIKQSLNESLKSRSSSTSLILKLTGSSEGSRPQSAEELVFEPDHGPSINDIPLIEDRTYQYEPSPLATPTNGIKRSYSIRKMLKTGSNQPRYVGRIKSIFRQESPIFSRSSTHTCEDCEDCDYVLGSIKSASQNSRSLKSPVMTCPTTSSLSEASPMTPFPGENLDQMVKNQILYDDDRIFAWKEMRTGSQRINDQYVSVSPMVKRG
ncbi:BA75_04295T0 [Komagataella pastoris]|uniref:BA75_04295T0 n=1 Tax=Komagataella pastoris TaxID=4922 RepID=A0A1B2JF69_PICPA|nr:BA75_04295T0 [Komagataella pastoris]